MNDSRGMSRYPGLSTDQSISVKFGHRIAGAGIDRQWSPTRSSARTGINKRNATAQMINLLVVGTILR